MVAVDRDLAVLVDDGIAVLVDDGDDRARQAAPSAPGLIG